MNLSEQLKIELCGGLLFTRDMWCTDDHQGLGT